MELLYCRMVGKESLETAVGNFSGLSPLEDSMFFWVRNPRCMFMFVEIANPCIALGHFEVVIPIGVFGNVADAIFIHVVANEVDSRVLEGGIIYVSK